jgi:signal transduction histidine kinase
MTTALVDAPRTSAPAAWREWVPSVALAGIVAIFLLITPQVVDYYADGDGSSGWSTAWPALDRFTAAGFVTVVAGVVLGRRWPVWATILTVLPFLAVPWLETFVWGWWLGILAVAALAALDGLRRAVVPVAAAALVVVWYCGTETPAALPIGPVTSGSGNAYEWASLLVYLLLITATVGVAAAIGSHRRSRARDAGARATEQHALQVESLAGERARLARDLHDVVAHHVSLVAVRAESAPFVHPDLGDDARRVLAAIATDAREALTELRQVLVVLQRTSDEGERAPQPTACDVDALVTSAVAAGQSIVLDGEWHDVPPAAGYVLYRAVQEGLTNARRHASGAVTILRRTQTEDGIGFRMSNPAQSAQENGRGLIGMRERVEALGGTMTAVVVDNEFGLEIVVPA